MTITQGPATALMSTVIAEESAGVAVTYAWECSLGGTTTAECEYRNEVSVAASVDPATLSDYDLGGSTHLSQVDTTTLNKEDMNTFMIAVAVTAGAEMLTQTGAAQSGSAATTMATGSASAKPSGGDEETASGEPSGTKAEDASGSPTESAAGSPTPTEGAATHVQVGGLAVGGALMALFML